MGKAAWNLVKVGDYIRCVSQAHVDSQQCKLGKTYEVIELSPVPDHGVIRIHLPDRGRGWWVPVSDFEPAFDLGTTKTYRVGGKGGVRAA